MILGIDPGLTGALALLDDDGDLLNVWDMPTQIKLHGKGSEVNAYLLSDLVAEIREMAARRGEALRVIVEQVASMPGQGVASMFAFGESVGVTRAVIASAGLSMLRVRPTTWKRESGLTGRDKAAALTRAIELWPDKRSLFARKKDIGRADAALIALYGLSVIERN